MTSAAMNPPPQEIHSAARSSTSTFPSQNDPLRPIPPQLPPKAFSASATVTMSVMGSMGETVKPQLS